MRILHVLTRLLRAGSEENTLLTCAGQTREGHEVILAYGHEGAAEHAWRLAPGVGLIQIPSLTRELSPGRDLAAYRALRREMLALRPDVVHTHQSKAGILGRFAAASAGVPVVVHGVHILPFLGETGVKKAIYLRAELAAARVTHGFISVSEGMQAACLAHGMGRAVQHHVVRSGFDLRRFAEATPPDDWRALLRLAPDAPRPPVVVMLAALEPRKRHLELLDRLPPLVARFPGIRFVFAGEGHLADEIAARTAALGLGENVVLAGFREDPERIIALADVCLHCSDKEGLPRSVLQYLAAGRPTVMFHLPGIEDVIASGSNGIVAPEDAWPDLLAALAGLLDDPEARAALARAAGRTDLRLWDASTMAAQTLEIYHRHSAPPRYRTFAPVARPV